MFGDAPADGSAEGACVGISFTRKTMETGSKHPAVQHEPTRSAVRVKCCPRRQSARSIIAQFAVNHLAQTWEVLRDRRLRDHLTHPPEQRTVIMHCEGILYALSEGNHGSIAFSDGAKRSNQGPLINVIMGKASFKGGGTAASRVDREITEITNCKPTRYTYINLIYPAEV